MAEVAGLIYMPVTGPFYSLAQLERLWLNSGGTQESAPTAAAIAYAESSGGQTSSNVNTDGSTDYGLWEINTKWNPEYDATALTSDPNYNANAAIMLAGGTKTNADFSPWSTWWADPQHRTGPGQGAYQQYLSQAQAALTNATSPNLDMTPQGSAASGVSSSSTGWNWQKYVSGSGEDPRGSHGTMQTSNTGVPSLGKLFGLDTGHWNTLIWVFVAFVLLVMSYALFTHSGNGDDAPKVQPVPVPV